MRLRWAWRKLLERSNGGMLERVEYHRVVGSRTTLAIADPHHVVVVLVPHPPLASCGSPVEFCA